MPCPSTASLIRLVVLSVWIRLRSPYFPHQVCDANLFARLLVIIEPFAFVQLDVVELGVGLFTLSEPFPLLAVSNAPSRIQEYLHTRLP